MKQIYLVYVDYGPWDGGVDSCTLQAFDNYEAAEKYRKFLSEKSFMIGSDIQTLNINKKFKTAKAAYKRRK